MFVLKNRAVISIYGKGARKFLQGLLTNDIFKVNQKDALFFLMLNPKGRILYDFFIIEKDEMCLLLECDLGLLDEIMHRLSLYKLNHEVILGTTEYKVYVSLDSSESGKQSNNEITFIDPRNVKMGKRIFVLGEPQGVVSMSEEVKEREVYEKARIENCIADVGKDLIKEVSFPMEYRMDYAFSFDKGCYIGQEITARFKLKGEPAKKLYLLKFLSFSGQHFVVGDQIKKNDEMIGEIRSKVEDLALVYCKVKVLQENIDQIDKILIADDCKIQVIN